MKICPKCGKVLTYNSYFGAYLCPDCNWEDSTIGDKRNRGISEYRIEKKRGSSFSKKNEKELAVAKV